MQSIEELYTRKSRLYHLIFIALLRYDKGLLSFFNQYEYLKSGIVILDAGCGSGTVTKMLYRRAQLHNFKKINYYAFDITQAMLDRFTNWIEDEKIATIRTWRADILDFNNITKDWPDFDLIVSSAMLEYLPKEQLPIALQNLSKLLSKNGKLVIFITKKGILNRWLIKKWWKANTYTRNELKSVLGESGFARIKFRKFPEAYSYLNRWGFIIEAKLE